MLGDIIRQAANQPEEEAQRSEYAIQGYRAAFCEKSGSANPTIIWRSFSSAEKSMWTRESSCRKESVELEPDNPACLEMLAELLYQKNQISEAFDPINRALELNPKEHYQRQFAKLQQALNGPSPARNRGLKWRRLGCFPRSAPSSGEGGASNHPFAPAAHA